MTIMIKGIFVSSFFLLFILSFSAGLLSPSHPKAPLPRLYYEIPKKNEKREIGRLLKNIIFPNIYTSYADTKDALPTVKVNTGFTKEEKKVMSARASASDKGGMADKNAGSFTFMDPDFEKKMEAKVQGLKPVRAPAGFVPPVPKFGRKEDSVKVLPDVSKYPKPRSPIVIYDNDSSGECRAVRDACTALDLIVEYRPCPGNIKGYSDTLAVATGGKRTLPYMVDNNGMYRFSGSGANDIIDHLFDAYYSGKDCKERTKFKGSGTGGGNLRADARVDNIKMKPITLYGWEGASYVKPVRAALNSLALAHIFVNCANGSANRKVLESRTKTFQVPYIVDPNTGVSMFESSDIVKYLEATYTKK